MSASPDPLGLLGAAVRRLRLERGLTSEALASRAGLAPSALSRIEQGVSDPRMDTLLSIAAGLGITLAEMVCAAEGSAG